MEHLLSKPEYLELQRRYGGSYVARRGARVVAAATTYGELADKLEGGTVVLSDLIVEYVRPVDSICVY